MSPRPGLGYDQGCRGLAWSPAPPSLAFLPSPSCSWLFLLPSHQLQASLNCTLQAPPCHCPLGRTGSGELLKVRESWAQLGRQPRFSLFPANDTVTLGPCERTGCCWVLGPGRCALARAEHGTVVQLGAEPREEPSATTSHWEQRHREVCEFPRAQRWPARASGRQADPGWLGGVTAGSADYEITTCQTDSSTNLGSAT